MLNRIIAIGFLLLAFVGCEPKQEGSMEEPVARVLDTYFYQSDLEQQLPSNLTGDDSITMARSIIRSWIEKQLLIHQAELNLTDELKDVERKLQEYRNDLLIYSYESELVRQRLDTNITEEEINNYYQENSDNFVLRDHILKVFFVKTRPNAPNLDELKEWMSNMNEENYFKTEDYCKQFASNCFLDESSWLYLEDLMLEVPIPTEDMDAVLKKNHFVDMSDSNYVYMVLVRDFKKKDTPSPLELEREKIRNIVINHRKIELIEQMHKSIFKQGLANDEFEIYE